MKFDYDFTMTGMDGMPLTDENGMELHAGRTAARLIMRTTETGSQVMIRYDWAMQLHKLGNLDLDKAGQAEFRKLLETMPSVPLAVRGGLIEVLDKRQEELSIK